MESQAEEKEQVWRAAMQVLMARGLCQRDAVTAADYVVEFFAVLQAQFADNT